MSHKQYTSLQSLSETVASAMEHDGGEEVSATVKFIWMMDKFFDCLNVKKPCGRMVHTQSFSGHIPSS